MTCATRTPELDGFTWDSNMAENWPTEGSEANTASLRRYGPPSGVRVVSALARFSTSSSVRARWADMPDALTERAEKRLMRMHLPGWRFVSSAARIGPEWWPPGSASRFRPAGAIPGPG